MGHLVLTPSSPSAWRRPHDCGHLANRRDPARDVRLGVWGDDIGYWNLSAYNMGMMGYETPNIDRIASEGMIFTDA